MIIGLTVAQLQRIAADFPTVEEVQAVTGCIEYRVLDDCGFIEFDEGMADFVRWLNGH